VSNLPILHQKWLRKVLWLLIAIYTKVLNTCCAMHSIKQCTQMWNTIPYCGWKWINRWEINKTVVVVPTIPCAIAKFYLENVCLPAWSQRSRRKSSSMVMGTTVVSSVVDSCCKVCWLSSGSNLVVVSSLWPLSEPLLITSALVSVVEYTIYGITFRFWIMVTWSTCLFSYSYLIQLLMQPTLKVLKHVNCHLHSSQKITNETGKTLHNHFWCSMWKFNTFLSIIYSWYNI